MSVAALALVIAAAVVHAGWNLLSKQASQGGGVAFVWLVAAGGATCYLPVGAAVLLVVRPHIGWVEIGFLAGTTVLHAIYFLLLQSGYRVGDLSLVYPLARGTGPLLASLAAIALFRERPGAVGLTGIVLVVGGVFVLGLPGRSAPAVARPAPAAIGYGLLTGVLIASYTLWDAYAVSALAIPPLLYMWGSDFGRALLLTPLAYRRRAEVAAVWRCYRRQALGTAILSPLSYVLVLTALTFSPVSAIAPARELSVLLVVLLGGRLLAEGHLPRRLLGAAAIAGGIIAIAAS